MLKKIIACVVAVAVAGVGIYFATARKSDEDLIAERFETFEKAVEEYIDYYNNKRIQAKTKWMPPVKYREASMCSA